jgi:tRNA(Arg) A34 adenosine deaminase TadA
MVYSNLGKKWSIPLGKIVNNAIETAKHSCLKIRHGAVLFGKLKDIVTSEFNDYGHCVCGFDVPSRHAEAKCLKPIYNKMSRSGKLLHRKKYSILVVRINADCQLSDSQPCCMCLNMMKINGIHRVYYSDNNGNLICQNINQLNNNDCYFSHGLILFVNNDATWISKKLPLTRLQKKQLSKK